MDVDKLLQLFEGPNSGELQDRHLAALQNLASTSAGGFAVHDLAKVPRILQLTYQLIIKGRLQFLEPTLGLVR
jgi:hypothetical protein